MPDIKVSIIGLAHAAIDFYLPGLSKFKDVELSICDIRRENLISAGELFGIPPQRQYTDYRRMLDKEDPEAVYVLMAQYPHGNYDPQNYFMIVNNVIEQKRAILVEKPLALTPKEALPLVKAVEKSGVVNMCSVNRRFYPTVLYAIDKISEHGPIVCANCSFYKSSSHSKADTLDWLTSDLMHALDLMRFLIGKEIVEFHPLMSRTKEDITPTAFHALARFANGATGIFSSSARAGARRELYQIHGIGISAYIESDPEADNPKKTKISVYSHKNTGYKDSRMPIVLRSSDLAGTDDFAACCGFTGADRYFIDCVKNKKQPHNTFAESYKTICYCDKILKSPLAISVL